MTVQQLSAVRIGVSERIKTGLTLILFGSLLIYGVGLAHSERLHNAAHDTRHAIGFPCH